MRYRTSRWDAAIQRSNQMTTVADILFDGDIFIEGLSVIGGSVVEDRSAAARGRLQSLQLAEPALIPQGLTPSALSPYGYEVQVRRGIVYPDGTVETMSLGVFPIQQSSVDGITLATTITAIDRSQRVRDAKLDDDYTIAANTNIATAIHDLIDAQVSGLTYMFASTAFTSPQAVLPVLADPWDAAVKMAKAAGLELFFNGDGFLVLQPEPDVRTVTPVWTISDGTDGVMLNVTVAQDRGPAFNKVIASSQNSAAGAQYRGQATDDDPYSPTYYDGPFGKKPIAITSEFIGSNAQATAAATAKLSRNLGVARSLTMSTIPNPALEAGDAISVTRTAAGVNEVQLADSITTDLSPSGAQQLISRARQSNL